MSVVSSVLIPIIKLWLRSQVEHIETIEIAIAPLQTPERYLYQISDRTLTTKKTISPSTFPKSEHTSTSPKSDRPPHIPKSDRPKNDYYPKKQIYCRMFGIEFIIKKTL